MWGRDTDIPVVVDFVHCNSNEKKLSDCAEIGTHLAANCIYGGGAAVQCREEQLRVKNVSAVTMPYYVMHTVVVSWELYKGGSLRPSSFKVECFNQQQRTELYVNNSKTLMMMNIGGLLSSTSYKCCVSAIYNYGHYVTEKRCTLIETALSESFTSPASNKFVSSDLNMRASIIGGVLGSIIVILLLLLAICGGALLYLLRSRGVIPKR